MKAIHVSVTLSVVVAAITAEEPASATLASAPESKTKESGFGAIEVNSKVSTKAVKNVGYVKTHR